MQKYLLAITGLYALITMSSSAALMLTFTEELGGVVMRTSGVVDASGSWFSDNSIGSGASPKGHSYGIESYTSGGVNENFLGVDLLIHPLFTTDSDATSWTGDQFYLFQTSFLVWEGAVNDDAAPASGSFSVDATLTWAGA